MPRRPCAKCDDAHMNYEHNFYSRNPITSKLQKAYYYQILRQEITEYDQKDYNDCITSYHAAGMEEEQRMPN